VSSFGGIFFVMELIQWQSSIRTFSQIQLHTRHESKKFQSSFYIFGQLLKPYIYIYIDMLFF
jgi:hypothetical protein